MPFFLVSVAQSGKTAPLMHMVVFSHGGLSRSWMMLSRTALTTGRHRGPCAVKVAVVHGGVVVHPHVRVVRIIRYHHRRRVRRVRRVEWWNEFLLPLMGSIPLVLATGRL
jgi:hypothetical protein